MDDPDAPPPRATASERATVLSRLEEWLEKPMIGLGILWLALLVVELVHGTYPVLETLSTAIWVVFVADFVLRLWLAPRRAAYLRSNWLAVLSLALPALRLLRIARLAAVLRAGRAARGVRAVRLATSLNRAMRSVRRALAQGHGAGYVAVLTALVVLAGAAGMYAFERGPDGDAFDGYAHAVWWTAMLVASMGTEIWPRTLEGRVLSLALTLYGFAVFGYITAALASWLVGRRAAPPAPPPAGGARS